jgi:probable addiction module antidote protein
MLEYLELAMEDDNPDVFIAALRHVARARGMSQLAEISGLGRELRYETVQKIVNVLGFRLSLQRTDAA